MLRWSSSPPPCEGEGLGERGNRAAKRSGHTITALSTHERLRGHVPRQLPSSMAIPLLLIVSHPPGAGKTALAHRLATELELALTTKDDIKEQCR